MKKAWYAVVLLCSLIQGAFSQDALVGFSDGPGRIYVQSLSLGQVFRGEELLGSVGPEEPLLVQGLPEGPVELVFLSSLGGKEVRKLDLRKNGIPTIRFGSATPVAPAAQDTDRERAVSLVQGRDATPPATKREEISRPWWPELQGDLLSFRDSQAALGSFQFMSPEYRSLNVGAFISRRWLYVHPRYSFQWSHSDSEYYRVHQLEAGVGLTAFALKNWILYSGFNVSGGNVDGQRNTYNSWWSNREDEYGYYFTGFGWEGGMNYLFQEVPLTLGLRLFAGYSRGMEWIHRNNGLTFSGEINLGWQFDFPSPASQR